MPEKEVLVLLRRRHAPRTPPPPGPGASTSRTVLQVTQPYAPRKSSKGAEAPPGDSRDGAATSFIANP